VYDYLQGQWGTFPGIAAKDAVLWETSYVFLRTNGFVYQEDPTIFKDDGAPIRMAIGTGWIPLGGVQGYQRVYKMMLIGEYKSPHKLRVSIGYDFADTYTNIAYIDPNELAPVNTYGSESPYGTGYFGGRNPIYPFIVNIKKQKCQAIRFLIEELTTSATEGTQEGFTLTSIGLQVGMKQGFAKLKTSKSVAAGD
jgi:hypothetical protein